MKILFCSSEIVPFAKTGGLADVAGALPLALEGLGIQIKLAMPKYSAIQDSKFNIKKLDKNIFTTKIGKDIDTYFIDNEKYFNRQGLYGEKTGDYPDNLDRFSFYCKETLELIKRINFKPDIIHCNDWQSALISIYLKNLYAQQDFYKNIKTIMTIHNLAYQGLFPKEQFPKLGLDGRLFNIEALEFYDKISVLKGGIVFSDVITTVSQTYSKEIQTQKFGCGLEGILAKRKECLVGIINGLDYNFWDPAKDNLIFKKYSQKSLEDRYINKEQLQSQCGLSVKRDSPLLGYVGRLAEQKGIEILAEAIKNLAKTDIQIIILGTGDQKYHQILEEIAKEYPDKVSLHLKFDNTLAHRIYAGCDLFLMPSRYEPCGLGQMISMKYATVPVVYKTGGLADTVFDFASDREKGNGFVFDVYSKEAFIEAINNALGIYKDRRTWQNLLRRLVKYNFSWAESAKKYIELYKKCL